MNMMYYHDASHASLAQREFSSKPYFRNSAAVEARYVQLVQPGPISLVRGDGMSSRVGTVRAPVVQMVQPQLWPSQQLHATFCNTTQVQYLVRSLLIKY